MSRRQQYIEEALAAYQIAGQYRTLGMRTGLLEFAELSKLYIERAWRFERYANELPANEVKPVVEEKKEMHPISRLITLFVIVLLVLSMGSAGAQDVPLETNTPDVIEGTATLVESTAIAPTAEVTPAPPNTGVDPSTAVNLITLITGIAIGVVTAGGGILVTIAVVVSKVRNDKPLLTAIEGLIASRPPEDVSRLRDVGSVLRDTAEIIDEVTDGVPVNTKPPFDPQTAAAIRTSAIPNTPGNQG